ncbi:MAG TPA: histidine kinase dimerization/phospho-acceptor domain-containing protein, partial [Methylovirgula sp.]
DITASRQAQDTLERAEAELAHVARIATLGELTTTIAHEVNQPLTGIVTNGEACLRWLDRDEIDIDEVTDTLKRIVRDGRRAGDVIQRLRTLSQKAEPQRMPLEINDIVTDAVSLLQREIDARHVSLKLDLLPHLPIVNAGSGHRNPRNGAHHR